MKRCKECGLEVPDSCKVCFHCDSTVFNERPNSREATKLCPKCGKPIPEGNQICFSCANVTLAERAVSPKNKVSTSKPVGDRSVPIESGLNAEMTDNELLRSLVLINQQIAEEVTASRKELFYIKVAAIVIILYVNLYLI